MVAAIIMSLAAMGGALAAAAGARGAGERDAKPRVKGTRKIAVREAKKVDKARRRARKAEKQLKRAKAAAKKAKRAARKAKRRSGDKPPKPSKRGARKRKPAAKDTGYKVSLAAEKKKKKKKKARKLDLPKPTKKKKKKKKGKKRALSPKGAAKELYSYAAKVLGAGKGYLLGTRGKPSRKVKRLQGDMGRVKKDGQYGRKTRARGRELLGKPFPIRRARTRTDKAPEPSKPSDEPARTDPEEPRGAEGAARRLLGYARAVPNDHTRASKFGYRGNTNDFIEQAQLDMGMSEEDADGIYGPATRTLGKELTGEVFPAR